MKAMNSPGLTLGTANRAGTVRVASFGFSNPALKQPVEPTMLFHIGSITKSFVALMCLQLHEEGKLDLHKPVLDYLPWLPIVTTYGPVSAHDLLTHSSGLPNPISLIPSDPSARYRQAWKPGERFYYCNMGFDTLGNLIAALDGRTWPAALKARILDPLGMKATAPVITNEIRPRTAESWVAYFEDRPYPRSGRLAPAANLQFDDAAGSIASTPADMTLYMQMLLNRGQGAHARIVSPESFALMSKPWIKADEFGPNAELRIRNRRGNRGRPHHSSPHRRHGLVYVCHVSRSRRRSRCVFVHQRDAGLPSDSRLAVCRSVDERRCG